MINWIHLEILPEFSGSSTTEDICRALLFEGISKDAIEMKEDQELLVDSKKVDKIIETIVSVSEVYPDENIRVRYLASVPGSYHEVIGICRNGKISIKKDEKEKILKEGGEL